MIDARATPSSESLSLLQPADVANVPLYFTLNLTGKVMFGYGTGPSMQSGGADRLTYYALVPPGRGMTASSY